MVIVMYGGAISAFNITIYRRYKEEKDVESHSNYGET